MLSAGDTYTAGSVGGEASHTLTVGEMPSHSHVVAAYSGATVNTVNTGGYTVLARSETTSGVTGGSQPHNNMPPYLTVYTWQRIS